MALPVQLNGGRPFAELAYLGLKGAVPPAIPALGVLTFQVPWGLDGMRRGLFNFQANARAGGGTFRIQARPIGFEATALPTLADWEDIAPDFSQVAAQASQTRLLLLDGTLPGNWNHDDGTTKTRGGNNPNPTEFNNGNYIEFRIVNVTGAASLVFASMTFVLSGG